MIPDTMFETGSEGEKQIYNALRNLLPQTYIVLHSLRWVGGDHQAQGEADFVIFHPQKGILVLEVKAGIIECVFREWYQTNRNTGEKKLIRDPEEQASGSKFKLINYIQSPNCLVCHAVWFPSIEFKKGNLPPNYEAEMLLDIKALNEPQKYIDIAFDYWSNQLNRTTSLNNFEADKILHAMAPSLRLVPSVQVEYDNKEKQFIQLTQDQARILDFLALQEKATISGAAGTGKTLIAIEKARQLKALGRKVLFLCYNRLLKDFLNVQFKQYDLDIFTFDSLAAQFVGVQSSFEKTRQYFLDYLITEQNDFPYTDIVIDEGQDFESDWLEYLDYRIKGNFYVFFDHQQAVQNQEPNSFLLNAPTRLSLTTNCRNTKAIALTAYGGLGNGLKHPVLSDIDGKQPEIIPFTNPNTDAVRIDKLIKSFVKDTKVPLHKIALLTFGDWQSSMLSFIADNLSLTWSETYEEDKLCITTARKFKGLEADLVILTDIDWTKFEEETYRKLFYTSCSRAKHELYFLSPDVNDIDVNFVLKHTQTNSKRKGKIRFLKLFNLKG